MNYYEELGIRADAEAEDIRKAHRRLVKLMHPDQQRDPHMKLLAETQMRRLNTIVSTLLNPTQRGEYDEALRGRHVARPVSVNAWRGMPWWLVRAAAASILSVGGIWFLADHFGNSLAKPLSIPPREMASVLHSSPAAGNLADGADPSKASTASITPVSVGVITVASQPADRIAQGPANANPGGTAASSADSSSPAAGGALEGDWVYAPKEPEKQKEGFYPPQFIEFKLLQQHQGGLNGQYSARYEVSGMNNPVSPDVSFQVAATGKNAHEFIWHNSTGSRGTLAVHAVDGRTIRIEWRTTVALGPPAFTSGIATLVRRR